MSFIVFANLLNDALCPISLHAFRNRVWRKLGCRIYIVSTHVVLCFHSLFSLYMGDYFFLPRPSFLTNSLSRTFPQVIRSQNHTTLVVIWLRIGDFGRKLISIGIGTCRQVPHNSTSLFRLLVSHFC